MKKFIFMLLALVAFSTANAQLVTMTTTTTSTVTLDTVTNSETEYLYKNFPGMTYGSVQIVCTKISGAPNGVINLEVSDDGVNYYILNTADTFHVANVTPATTKIWTLTLSPYLYYRVSALGRGTAAYQINAYLLARKD